MINSSRKKIRGWKRRVRDLERWGNNIQRVDLDLFEKHGQDYAKCIIDPFYRLIKRDPPLWFFRLMVGKLVAAIEKWNVAYKNQPSPYDLQLWLYDPHFIRSEIVCKKVDKEGDKYSYFNLSDEHPTFPFEKFPSLTNSLKKFNWEKGEDDITIDQEDIDEGHFKISNKDQNNYTKHFCQNGQAYHRKVVGTVWVGRWT